MAFWDCIKGLDEEEKEQRKQNKALEKMLKEDKKKLSREKRLLLLGTGEAGKSTFLKSLKITIGDGINDQEKQEYVKIIHQNIIIGIILLVKYMEQMNIPYQNELNKGRAATIAKIDPDDVERLKRDEFIFIQGLWEDDRIQEIFKKRAEYEIQISDSVEYFFDRLEMISKSDYMPTEQDILYIRQPTSGITFTTFHMNENVFKVIDVGGQRGERKKWINVFDDITAVIFLTAISEYDQILDDITHERTSGKKKRMDESMETFGTILNNNFFLNSFFFLFLNKKDLFEKKIMDSNLKDHFPEFEGPEKDPVAAMEFIKKEFGKWNKTKINIYTHFTSAVETKNTKKIFETVRAEIMKKNMPL